MSHSLLLCVSRPPWHTCQLGFGRSGALYSSLLAIQCLRKSGASRKTANIGSVSKSSLQAMIAVYSAVLRRVKGNYGTNPTARKSSPLVFHRGATMFSIFNYLQELTALLKLGDAAPIAWAAARICLAFAQSPLFAAAAPDCPARTRARMLHARFLAASPQAA